MNRLLVLGAGATIEECKRSGNYPKEPDRYLPVISNFARKLFDPTSSALQKGTASYLKKHSIKFDNKLLNIKVGDIFNGEDIEKSPVGVFLQLEKISSNQHNIETLCEHIWNAFENDKSFWAQFVHEGIYLHLFALFSEQFGLGLGKQMHAGKTVVGYLHSEDVVINLNYDIVFDLAMKQAKASFYYSPDFMKNAIRVLKPHGSLNFYVNIENGNCFFEQPDKIPGSVSIPDPQGGNFFAQHGIVPPRLNKNYKQHPAAEMILNEGRPFLPKIITFGGVGLTNSDIDLISIYKEAIKTAKELEFINPSDEAHKIAEISLGRKVTHYRTLDDWGKAQKA